MTQKKHSLVMLGIGAYLGTISMAEAACDASQPNHNPIDQYVINGEEVYDKKTGLTWARCSFGQHWREGTGCVGEVLTMPWDEAIKQGPPGWRVPTEEELVTLVSPSCKSPSLNDEVFPGMDIQKLWYWSSSSCGPSCPEHVNFELGNFGNYGSPKYPGAIRLVRNAE